MKLPKTFIHNAALTVGCATLSLILGGVFLLVVKPVYEAETRLYLRNSQITDAPQGVQDRQFIATQAEIIRSPLIIREALKVAPIELAPDFTGDEVKVVMDKLNVAPVLDTDIVSISFKSNSAEEAVSFVQALVNSFQQQLRRSESRNNSETLELLTNREKEVHDELESLNQKHLDLRSKYKLVGQSRDALSVYSAMLNDLAQKLTDARLEKIELASRLDSLTSNENNVNRVTVLKPSLPVGEELANSNIPQANPLQVQHDIVMVDLMRDQDILGAQHLAELETQIVAATIRLQTLETKFGPQHVQTRQAADQIQKLEQMLAEKLQANVESLKLQYERSVKAETDLEELYRAEQKTVKELDTYLVQDEKIRAEIMRTELMYKTILDRLGEIKLNDQALQSGQSSVVVQDLKGAEIIAEKIWPQPKSFLAICLMVGACGGFMLTFGMDALRAKGTSSSTESA